MKLSQVKSAVKQTIRENFKQSLSEASYNLGSEQYTKKNLTPTEILDLAMAYAKVPGKGNPMYGKKMPKMIVVANDLAKLNGTIQQNASIRSKEPALILTLMKNGLITKDEYVKLYKNLLEKQISVIGALKNADPASRMVGGAAARQAHKDMKGEFEESVNEGLKHLIHVETPKEILSKSVASQIMALAKKGVRSSEIGLNMGFVGNNNAAVDSFQKVKNKIYFSLDKRNESVNELKTLSNGNFKIKKQYNTFADYEKNAKIGDTILKYNKKSSMKDMISNDELNQNAKRYLNKVHSIGTDGVNVTLFGKQTPSSIHPSDKKELSVLVLESNINESFVKGKTYGGTKCEGGCFIGKQGLMKIIKISKESPNNTFIFRQDNFSGLQPHFIKNGVIGKATTLNPSYDLDRNKVRNLKITNDIILSIQLFD